MNLFKLSIFALSFSSIIINAQTSDLKHCGQTEAMKQLFEKRPDLKLAHEKHLNDLKNNSQHKSAATTTTSTYVIPIVFHILHEYGAENISDAQVIDAVRIINEDFQLRNNDTSNIVTAFKNLKANVNFEFRLAKKDPQGNCTNGILHVPSGLTNSGSDDVKFGQWPPNKYLNIWVVKKIYSGAAGYAYYPSSANGWPDIDGIVILSTYVGSIGTGTYNRSRALTHEIGHYMDLEHVWGSTNQPGVECGDDGVMDTPETKGWSSCTLSGQLCTTGIIENVQNYMEYAYCSNMFTIGQKQRMTDALTSSIAQRNNLWSAANLLATGTDDAAFTNTTTVCKPTADFSSSYKFVCQGGNIQFTDASYNSTVDTRQWFFQGGTPATSTLQTQSVIYSTPGTYEVKLKVLNAQGADSITKTDFIQVTELVSPNPGNWSEGFEGFSNISSSNWLVSTGGDLYTWEIANTGKASSKSIRINNLNATQGDVDEIITPTFNLSNVVNPVLTFDVAFAQAQSWKDNTDKLRVLISKDCGKTWTQRFEKSGLALATVTTNISSNFIPNSTQWRTETLTLPSVFIGANTRFKFAFTNGEGNNIYIDNINVSSSVGVKEFEATSSVFMDISPNPSSAITKITIYSQQDTEAELYLTDLLGKTIIVSAQQQLLSGEHNIEFNVSEIPNGIYILSIKTKFGISSKKMIVSH